LLIGSKIKDLDMGSTGKPLGLTKDTGWQIGLRRTLPYSVERLWTLLISPEGINTWLGKGKPFELAEGAVYKLEDGTQGEVRVFSPLSHFRITRYPPDPDYQRASTIQIRVLRNKDKATLVFHEEHLPHQEARRSRKLFYLGVVDQLQNLHRND
jgi:uncharacterized protein YndB with AHSA1/START domain